MRTIVLASTAAAALIASTHARAETTGTWTVTTTKDQCAMVSEWTDKKTKYGLVMGYTQKGGVFILTFMDSDLKFSKTIKIESEIGIDKNFKTDAEGSAEKDSALFLFEGKSPIIQKIADGNSMSIDFKAGGETYSYEFSLEDTRAALAKLETCRATAD